MGHFFVLRGDLRQVVCDALLIPCDGRWDVSNVWRDVLPADRISRGHGHRLRVDVTDLQPDGGWVQLPSDRGERRQVALVQTAGDRVDVGWMVDQVAHAVARVAVAFTSSPPSADGRARPLIGLPLAGTGEGGLHGHRGEVIEHLLPRLIETARSTGVDVVLVLNTARDYAAVQDRRPPDQWPELDEEKTRTARNLGTRAAQRELSLFLGSGVSVPLGLPTWSGLLHDLARQAGCEPPEHLDGAEDYQEAAEQIVEALGQAYPTCMTRVFDVTRHSLSHGLLANLSVERMVTTNYDNAMELALDGVVGKDAYRVMPLHLVEGSRPWLLKLHGDIKHPDTLVLRKSDYQALMQEKQALLGTVQGLLLTGHLLFVGFSLVDEDFVTLAKDVRSIRARAAEHDAEHRAGTVVALHAETVQHKEWSQDLALLPMSEVGSVAEAARLLEVFLDRVAWEAAQAADVTHQYLLDPSYEASVRDPRAVALREALRHFAGKLPTEVKDAETTGWRIVQKALTDLGYYS